MIGFPRASKILENKKIPLFVTRTKLLVKKW